MHYTTYLSATRPSTGLCDVWNWDGGATAHSLLAYCDQKPLTGGNVGGNFSGVDVDAFTFNLEGYHERFSRLGSWHWRQKGVWTKIRSGEAADCGIGANNEIWCTLLWQP